MCMITTRVLTQDMKTTMLAGNHGGSLWSPAESLAIAAAQICVRLYGTCAYRLLPLLDRARCQV